jgi:hypothetical protein
MNTILFLVQGSALDPYSVVFTKSQNKLTVECSCPAGKLGNSLCKHRLRILGGDTEGIVSENKAEVSVVRNWLLGTELSKTFNDFQESEARFSLAKRDLDINKKKLAHALKL